MKHLRIKSRVGICTLLTILVLGQPLWAKADGKEEAEVVVEQVDDEEDKLIEQKVDDFLKRQEADDLKEAKAHASRPQNTCTDELIHSYRLFPRKDIGKEQVNYLCPYLKSTDDCCEKTSQNMIQILWGRISKPRLERELTYHLSAVETIINGMKDIMGLFLTSELPEHAEYSAECLDSVNQMKGLQEEKFVENLDYIYNYIKLGFERLYKLKKGFYCHLCDRRNHEYINVFDKQIVVSNKFCESIGTDFKDLVYFLNFQMIKQFQTVRNFVLCYREKNYLLVKDVYKFKFDKAEMKIINDCMFSNACSGFCGKYSMSALPEFFIGNREFLDEMRKFILKNKVLDNSNFEDGSSAEEETEDQKEEEIEAEVKKMEFFKPENRTVDEVQWDFWKEMFDISKQKVTQKKMASIRRKMKREFEENMLHESFITANKAKIILENFNLKHETYGMNFYDSLDKEELYKTNSQLTFYMTQLDNTVGELLNLDETSILKSMINVSKYIKGEDNPEEMVKYIESKIFQNREDEVDHLVENPYFKNIGQAILSLGLSMMAYLLYIF